MLVDRALAVELLAVEMRRAGVPDAEEVAERIGDRYVALLEEKARELWLGVSPLTPTGFLRVERSQDTGEAWIRRRFLEIDELVTDEIRADACYPNHRAGGTERS